MDSTDGSLRIKTYYGPCPADEDLIRKLEIGQLNCIGLFSGGTILLCPETGVLQLPFLFNDYGEVDFIRHKMAPDFDGFFERKGLVLLSWVHMDFDPVFSAKYRFENAGDFKSAVFTNSYGWLEGRVLDHLGAAKITCGMSEAGPVLDRGMADSIIEASYVVVGRQTYNLMKFVNPMPVHYSPAIMVVKQEAFEELPEAYRTAVLRSRLPLADQACEAILEDNRKYLNALVDYGLEVGLTPPDQYAIMKERSRPVYEEATGKLFQRELLDELEQNLEIYRANRVKGE